MEIVDGDGSLRDYFERAARVAPEHPVLIDRFLEDAFEADVDAIADGRRTVIGRVMQHIEDAGVHSGDSACVLPPYLIGDPQVEEMRRHTKAFAEALGVVGLINVQFAIQQGVVHVLEVNPRASRTVPFVSKATGQPLAKIAARCMLGRSLADQGARVEMSRSYFAVKEAVFPFVKFPGVDPLLGPEMRSTGEVMGVGRTFGEALFKSQLAAGATLPPSGTVFLSVKDSDKPKTVEVARLLHDMGYGLVATRGTAAAVAAAGIPVRTINKVKDGRPHVVDLLK